MAMTPGLSPNLRLVDDEPAPQSSEDVIIEMAEEPPERKVTDDKGNVLEIEYPDGSIAISLDGKPIERNDDTKATTPRSSHGHSQNKTKRRQMELAPQLALLCHLDARLSRTWCPPCLANGRA